MLPPPPADGDVLLSCWEPVSAPCEGASFAVPCPETPTDLGSLLDDASATIPCDAWA